MLPVRTYNEKRTEFFTSENSYAIFCAKVLKFTVLVAKQWIFGFPFFGAEFGCYHRKSFGKVL